MIKSYIPLPLQMEELYTQLTAFIAHRDSALNHELFGGFPQFRDLQVLPPLQISDFSQFEQYFRQISSFSPDSAAPLITPENALIQPNKAIYQITNERFERTENAAYSDAQATLANPAIDSNKQFAALATSQNANYYMQLFAQWIVTRCPAGRRNSIQLENKIKDIIRQNTHDNTILRQIYTLFYQKQPPPPKQSPPPNSPKRQNQRVSEITQMLQSRQISNALDIGCSDGFVIFALGQKLKIDVFGMDVRPPTAKINFKEVGGSEIVEEFVEKFDLVTIMMTLHHISQWKTSLQNAAKYVKKGGFLFIRDHDAFENDYKILLDLHDQAFNSAIWETPESDIFEFQANCRSWFLSYLEVKEEILGLGFKMVNKFEMRSSEFDWRCFGSVWYALFEKVE